MKVWTMKYVGHSNLAPGILNVPSARQLGGPSHDEIVEALKNLGYSRDEINNIAGGPDSWWKPV